jgi:NADH-quinone oxidoreductase subunit N
MLVVAIIALLNSVVSLYYYVRVIKHMYLVKPEKEAPAVIPNLSEKILLTALVVPVLLLGVYFQPLVDWAKNSLEVLGLM